MAPEQIFGQLLELGKSCKMVETWLEANSSTFVLKVKETVVTMITPSGSRGAVNPWVFVLMLGPHHRIQNESENHQGA